MGIRNFVLVTKLDGEYFLCFDYRPLNQVTKTPLYPLPRVHQALDTLQGKQNFFTFDLLKAYWQIPVYKDTREYLAFTTSNNLYEWLRMPFEIAGASAVQQRMMDFLLAGMKWISALACFNDIVVHSKVFNKHLSHFDSLL